MTFRLTSLSLVSVAAVFVGCGGPSLDANGDGLADDLGQYLDFNGDGEPDEIDFDGDGVLDGLAIDTNGDGKADGVGIDTDGDGIIDAVDSDGDGTPDVFTELGGDGDGSHASTSTGGASGSDGSGGSGASLSASGGSRSGTGGESSSGSGGETAFPPMGLRDVIDDFEDGDVLIEATDSRVGYWYSYNEDYARPRLAGTSSDNGGKAIRASGSHKGGVQADQAYGGLGVDLKNADPNQEGPRASVRQVYDASEWDGFEFSIKGSAGTKSIRFEIVTTEIAESSEKGKCTAGEKPCWDAYGMDVPLSTEWRTFKVPFSSVVQEGWGKSVSFMPEHILGIAFEDLGTGSWDFSVDDLAFYTDPPGSDGGGSSVNPMCAGSWGSEANGSITWYTFDQGTSGIGDINCSYGIQTGPDRVTNVTTGGGQYFGAMNTADYQTASACGACVEVSASNGKKVNVTIVDQCPIGSNPKCVKGHIDLSKAAYDQLGLPEGYWGARAGKGTVSWKYVPCAPTGNVKFRLKEPANLNWNMVLVENHTYPIAKVEVEIIRDGSTVWANASREEYNYWLPPGGKMGTYKVKATDVNGKAIVDTISLMSGSQDAGGQYSCN